MPPPGRQIDSVRMLQPIYVRLQPLQNGSVILWEAVPQSFQDHVGTIDLSVLAVFVSSNALSLNLSRDAVGNLWLTVNYTFDEGDYISSLIWVSSETISENLTIPEFVPFPESYPEEVKPFLEPGRNIPVNDTNIQRIATENKTQNMVETVRNVLDFVTESQEYNRETIKLFMNGSLETTNILDSVKDPIECMETGSSFCFERSLYATTILRAAGVPARTFTDAGLKTWIQVWLLGVGWVDAEALCILPPPMFPRSLSSSMPWMVQNSSHAMFPFYWHPEISMRVANLTFSDVEAFNVGEYGTILCEPIDIEVFEQNPDKFGFPVIFEPEIVYVAITQNETNLALTIIKDKEEESKILALGETNKVALADVVLSFEPIIQGDFVVLRNFTVRPTWRLDILWLFPVIGVSAVMVLWVYWRRRH